MSITKRGVTLGLIISILILSFFSLAFVKSYETPTLLGRWISEETGTILEFTSKGTVIIKDSTMKGIYHIISPDTMEYTINDFSFIMSYAIEGRNLYWGIDENHLESFVRK